MNKDYAHSMQGDLISRQAAIDAVRKIVPYVIDKDTGQWGILVNKANVITELSALPYAEPLVLTCDGCRHVGTYDTEFPCSGCIRREKDYYEQER